jgi:hypothetical protein
VLTLYRRHRADCPHAEDRYYRKCRCAMWCAGVQALTKQARPLHRFFHLVANLRPEQCLRPYPEENGLGFAKVGLAPR